MGLDIGSATSKCVLLRGGKVAAMAVAPRGAGTSGPGRAVQQVLEEAGIDAGQVAKTVATGYGRNSVSDADGNKSELSCHAKAAFYLKPKTRTIIDIGGQDAKVICLDGQGRMENFAMNDKCAAGTGRFLDVMARVLELDVSELESAGMRSQNRLDISSTCTVFAESEVVSHLAASASIDDIVAGIHRSVASRVAGLAKRVELLSQIVMSGGVALNGGVVEALQQELGMPVEVLPNPQVIGALGAALYAEELL